VQFAYVRATALAEGETQAHECVPLCASRSIREEHFLLLICQPALSTTKLLDF
jgi:hypothetical protein